MAFPRRKYKVGDIVLVTARKMDCISQMKAGEKYITHITQVRLNRPGRRYQGTGPYRLFGFTAQFTRKEIQLAAPEKALLYKLFGSRKRRYDSL